MGQSEIAMIYCTEPTQTDARYSKASSQSQASWVVSEISQKNKQVDVR